MAFRGARFDTATGPSTPLSHNRPSRDRNVTEGPEPLDDPLAYVPTVVDSGKPPPSEDWFVRTCSRFEGSIQPETVVLEQQRVVKGFPATVDWKVEQFIGKTDGRFCCGVQIIWRRVFPLFFFFFQSLL